MCLPFSSFRSCSSIIWPKLISEDIKKCEMTLTHSIGLTFRVLTKTPKVHVKQRKGWETRNENMQYEGMTRAEN